MVQKVNNVFKTAGNQTNSASLDLPHLGVCSLVASAFVEFIKTLTVLIDSMALHGLTLIISLNC